jgi:CubicO group peptidase (beta-lactamase class C family)
MAVRAFAEAEQHLRRLPVTAARVDHSGHTVIEIGDVSQPVHIHSMRKSIMSALVGQAHDRGEIDLDATLDELSIDDTPSLTDEEKTATISNLLAARSGVYLPTEGGDALGRPPRGSHPPGTFWCYNNWDFNVLGNIYERLTGRSVFVAFEHDLARPLGMADWDTYAHGAYRYGADILGATPRYPNYTFHLSARDLGRIGHLYLNRGRWKGRQLLSPEWIARSTEPLSRTNSSPAVLGRYGYCWWIADPWNKLSSSGIESSVYTAAGFGGNFLSVLPDNDTVVTVVTDTAAQGTEPITPDDYQELLAHVFAALSS